MTCPIAYACWRTLHEAFFVGQRRFLYSDMEDQFDELLTRIREDEPAHAVVLLRGFFSLEVIYRHYLPQMVTEVTHVRSPLIHRLKTEEFPRSHAGVDTLIELLRAIERRVHVDTGVIELTGSSSNQERRFRVDTMRRVLPTLQASIEMAETVKRGLSQQSKLTRVGTLFGESLLNASATPETCQDHLGTLLMITLENPITPWSTEQTSPA